MTTQGSVSRLIADLKQGERFAAQELWERYYDRLVALARAKLHASRRRAADEEDVVQQAFDSFFRGVDQTNFPRLDDRNELWRLLVVITARKALDQIRYERSQRQGGGTVRGSSAIFPMDQLGAPLPGGLAGEEPWPEFAAQVTEEWRRQMRSLGDDGLQKVALWKIEGYTNEEIAKMLGVSLRTVARKLDVIRTLWHKDTQS